MDNCTDWQIDLIGLPHRQPLVLFYAEDKLLTACLLQNNSSLSLKRNAGDRKTNAFLCTIAFVREHYIKLRTANAAKKQEQCAEDQKRPIAGECGNNSRSQKRQTEQQRQQPLLKQRRGPCKDLFHIQHRSKTICLCRYRFAIAAETGRACRDVAIRIGKILAGGQFVIIQAIHELRIRAKRPHTALGAFDQLRAAEKRLIRQPHDLPFLCAVLRTGEQANCFRERCTVPNPELQKRAEPQKRICRYRRDIQAGKQIIESFILAATAPLRNQPAGDKPGQYSHLVSGGM